ncbi:MAG: DUF4956 domain-containing protein [Planctomycetota bacterium]
MAAILDWRSAQDLATLWQELGGSAGGTARYDVIEIVAALAFSLALALLLAYVYRKTHRGLSYSVSFVHTMIIMAVTVTIIMMIIGTNIARAFTLVGALSIIRFRTAIKDPRDVAFVFMAMAIGMACGTGFFGMAIVFTLFCLPMVYLLFRFEVGAMATSEVMLKVHLPENVDHHSAFREPFYEFLSDHSLLSVETIRGGALLELLYSVHFKRDSEEARFIEALRVINGNQKVALITGQQNVNV